VINSLPLAAGCGGPPPRPAPADVEFAQAMATARTSYDRGQVPQAVLFYERALRRAEARDDAADIGDAAYNLAVALVDDGQFGRAAGLLDAARAELARAGGRTTDVRLVRAKVARQLGDLGAAAAGAAGVARAPDATPAERCQAFVLLGQVSLDGRHAGPVPTHITDARAALAAAGGPRAGGRLPPRSRDALEAGVVGLEARLAEAAGDPARAGAAYDRQVTLARRAGMFADMSTALEAAGRSYAAAGDNAAAGDRLYRAARSLLAQGDADRGTAAAREAATAAGRSGDAELAARVAALIGGDREVPQSRPGAQTQPVPARTADGSAAHPELTTTRPDAPATRRSPSQPDGH
jgi:tetratricopeptide (TPR) repeat protein